MSDLLTLEDIMRLPVTLRPKSPQLSAEYKATMKPFEIERAEKDAAKLKEHQSATGALGLPLLLDSRRLEYGIPDEMFGAQAAFGFVLVYQIAQLEGETYGDTSIIMTERAKDRETKEAPRGIVVSAGLRALDELRSNGIDLGHIVMFSRNIPYRAIMTNINAKDRSLIVLHAGDIFASEDLARNKILGKCVVEVSTDEKTQLDYHYYRDTNGDLWKPHNVKKKV